MTTDTTAALREKTCQPCEGGVPPLSQVESERLLKDINGWKLADGGEKIRRQWTVKNFVAGIDFLNKLAELAEQEGHHPDVHLTDYRDITVELTTHAIGGLSENDFILAAKIDELPVTLKQPAN